MFSSIKATKAEAASDLPGDNIVPNADVIMDRAFSLPAAVDEVWPWFVQLGKNRAGWYFPKSIERFILPRKRALWVIDSNLQDLAVGDVIDDWGGKHATFEIADIEAPHFIVNKSKRGKTNISWTTMLTQETPTSTRVHLRLRLAPVKYKWLAETGGELIDVLTVAGLAAGLRQRLA